MTTERTEDRLVVAGVVGENLAVNFIPQVQCAEMRAFYTFQSAIETVHAQVYGELIETFVPRDEQPALFNAMAVNPSARMVIARRATLSYLV
eukprot:COSAG06_NODE_717_length_12831_cov_52.780003_11_plen_92_part_00